MAAPGGLCGAFSQLLASPARCPPLGEDEPCLYSSACAGDSSGRCRQKGAYPARAKPSVLVVLRMKASPERRQLNRGMSCPLLLPAGLCGTDQGHSSVGSAGSYCMAHASAGNPGREQKKKGVKRGAHTQPMTSDRARRDTDSQAGSKGTGISLRGIHPGWDVVAALPSLGCAEGTCIVRNNTANSRQQGQNNGL